MKRLNEKKAVVTGASSGIGEAIAKRFAAEGAEVIVNYRSSADRARQVVDAITAAGGQAHALQADIAEADQVRQLVGEAAERLGRIDIWVNNAGADILTGAAAALDDAAKLDRLLAVDLRGTMQCCQAVAPRMHEAGGGAIINMGWSRALSGMRGRNPELFAAAKAGVTGYSLCLARNLAPEIRVNVLAPGWIETAFIAEHMPDDYRRSVLDGVPLGRMGRPEEVAAAAVFLAAEDSGYITGHVLNVHGGEG